MATPLRKAGHVPASESTYQLGSGRAEPDLGMAGQRADRSGATQRNLGFSPGRTSARNGFPRLRCAGGPHGLNRSLGVRIIIIIIICHISLDYTFLPNYEAQETSLRNSIYNFIIIDAAATLGYTALS